MTISEELRTQDWFDNNLYPFESNYFTSEYGAIHYIDEGEGHPIVFVHGTPVWSFVFRNQIKELSKKYRCIALDHLGFGLSEKPKNAPLEPEAHASRFSDFIGYLNLDKFSLVVHDFGGPIALPYAIKNYSQIENIILFNTWLWATEDDKDVKKIDNIVQSWIGRHLYLRWNLSAWILIKQAFSDSAKLTSTIHKHYKKVLPNKKSRYGPLKLAESLAGSSDWYQHNWENLDTILHKKFMIIWGMEDEFIHSGYLKKWQSKLPEAEILKLPTGHFIQEESSKKVSAELSQFIGE